MIQKILRTLKHTEDATSQDATANIYILCDIALAMASALAKKSEKQKPAKGKGAAAAAVSHPGSVPLPSSFYKSVDLQSAGEFQSWCRDANADIYILCDVALAMANALVKKSRSQPRAKVQLQLVSVTLAACLCRTPSINLYTCSLLVSSLSCILDVPFQA